MFDSSGTDVSNDCGRGIDVTWPFTCRCGPSESTSIARPSRVATRTTVFDQLRTAANASSAIIGRPM